MNLYYRIANLVAFRIYVHGLDRQDKIQECVIKAWQALGEHPTKNLAPLIYVIMKNHLIALSRPTYNERMTTTYVEDQAMLSLTNQQIVIPLPKNKDERVVLVAWLESDGKLTVVCEMLGMNYWTAKKFFLRAQKSVYKKGYERCWLDKEQCWLRAL